MLSHQNAAIVISLLACAHAANTERKAKKVARLYLQSHKNFEETIDYLNRQNDFLCAKLDENEIEITEFDRIAFNNL